MIYGGASPRDPIDQADIVEGCPLIFVSGYDPDDFDKNEIEFVPTRVVVLTQTCDLVNRKTSMVTVAIVLDAHSLVDRNLLKPADIRGPIRAGRVFGWYFLPASVEHRLPEMVVDFRQLHTVRLDLLAELCSRGQRRARLLTPYREHLAKHFADTFSRIGLPEPYDTLL
jgi:hypothetical protein